MTEASDKLSPAQFLRISATFLHIVYTLHRSTICAIQRELHFHYHYLNKRDTTNAQQFSKSLSGNVCRFFQRYADIR